MWNTPRLNRVWLASLALWIAILIATPIAIWVLGDDIFPLVASLGVIAQFFTSMIALASCWPWPRIARMAVIVLVVSWLVETLGQATGFPFGSYDYTSALQPQLTGVPLLIPLAWLMMLVPAWGVTETLLMNSRHRLGRVYPWLFAVLAGVVFAAWDLYLDPQMVSRSLWIWEKPGAYFGIPLVNYFGWWLTAAVITFLVRPADLPRLPLLMIYTVTWLLQAIGLGIFWGQPGPALAGFVGMGLFAGWAWLEERKQWKSFSGLEQDFSAAQSPSP